MLDIIFLFTCSYLHLSVQIVTTSSHDTTIQNNVGLFDQQHQSCGQFVLPQQEV